MFKSAEKRAKLDYIPDYYFRCINFVTIFDKNFFLSIILNMSLLEFTIELIIICIM